MRARAISIMLALAGCSAKEGDTCMQETEARCADEGRMLLCSEHRWTTIACGGPAGCKASARFVDCDESIAVAGSPCGADAQGNGACAADGQNSLECKGGTWTHGATCRGPGGCTVSTDRRFVDCDDSLAMVDDRCLLEDTLSCASEGGAILRCSEGRFIQEQACDGGACLVDGDLVACEGAEGS